MFHADSPYNLQEVVMSETMLSLVALMVVVFFAYSQQRGIVQAQQEIASVEGRVAQMPSIPGSRTVLAVPVAGRMRVRARRLGTVRVMAENPCLVVRSAPCRGRLEYHSGGDRRRRNKRRSRTY